jgi:hypothetical protein
MLEESLRADSLPKPSWERTKPVTQNGQHQTGMPNRPHLTLVDQETNRPMEGRAKEIASLKGLARDVWDHVDVARERQEGSAPLYIALTGLLVEIARLADGRQPESETIRIEIPEGKHGVFGVTWSTTMSGTSITLPAASGTEGSVDCHGLPAHAIAWTRGSRYGRGTNAQGGHAMPVHRTELLDDLTALIAAGRELSPDHDRALAEVFIERLTSGLAPPSPTRQSLSVWRQARRLVGIAILALACLVAGSVLTLHHTGSASVVPVQESAKVPAIPGPGKRPIVPPGPKVPSVPQAPAPKTAP